MWFASVEVGFGGFGRWCEAGDLGGVDWTRAAAARGEGEPARSTEADRDGDR